MNHPGAYQSGQIRRQSASHRAEKENQDRVQGNRAAAVAISERTGGKLGKAEYRQVNRVAGRTGTGRCLKLATDLLVSAGIENTRDEARRRLIRQLDSGRAFEKFEQMVTGQGGRLAEPRPIAVATELNCDRVGFVAAVDTESLGWAIIDLGGGRRRLTDRIDPSVGLEMLVRLGDPVVAGQPWLRVFASPAKLAEVCDRLQAALTIGDSAITPPSLIAERIG